MLSVVVHEKEARSWAAKLQGDYARDWNKRIPKLYARRKDFVTDLVPTLRECSSPSSPKQCVNTVRTELRKDFSDVEEKHVWMTKGTNVVSGVQAPFETTMKYEIHAKIGESKRCHNPPELPLYDVKKQIYLTHAESGGIQHYTFHHPNLHKWPAPTATCKAPTARQVVPDGDIVY